MQIWPKLIMNHKFGTKSCFAVIDKCYVYIIKEQYLFNHFVLQMLVTGSELNYLQKVLVLLYNNSLSNIS